MHIRNAILLEINNYIETIVGRTRFEQGGLNHEELGV